MQLPSLSNADQLSSPALLFFYERILANIDSMIRIARRPDRLRPHCKTHKTRQIAELLIGRGITKHKCATLAEAEVLALAGARDIFLALQPVGPHIARTLRLRAAFPHVRLSVLVDHARIIEQLDSAAAGTEVRLDVILDLDVGQHRSGVEPGAEALRLHRAIAQSQNLQLAGWQAYDGHNHDPDPDQRRSAAMAIWDRIASLRQSAHRMGLDVPHIVCGGTPSFPAYATIEDPAIELSPGTCVLHDAGYGQTFPDLPFQPAAALLTRVISRPAADRVTLDLGYKAVSGDQPAGRRAVFPSLPDAREVLHNEEHLVLETSQAEGLSPGDALLAIPRHICPTVALHQSAHVVRDGKVVDLWAIAARDRCLTY